MGNVEAELDDKLTAQLSFLGRVVSTRCRRDPQQLGVRITGGFEFLLLSTQC